MSSQIIILDSIYPEATVVYVIHYVACAVDVFYIPFGAFYWVNKQYIVCTIKNDCDQLGFDNYSGKEFISMIVCMLLQIPVFSLLLMIVDVKNQGGRASDVFSYLFVSAVLIITKFCLVVLVKK